MQETVRIFLFHRVSDDHSPWAPAMSLTVFRKCIQFITSNYTVKTIEDYLAGPAGTDKPVACITFDDGFKDNVEYALPVLEKYKCPASFYITTGCIDNDLPTWPNLLGNMFENTGKSLLRLNSEYIKGGGEVKFVSREERVAYGRNLVTVLKTVPDAGLQKVMAQVKECFADVPAPHNYMMSWNEVRQLARAGYPVGSHTCSHPMLTKIEDDAALHNELALSYKRIKDECGQCSDILAYPIGDADDRVMKFAAAAGYKYGLMVEQKFYNTATDKNMAIPRVDLYHDSGWLKTRLRITGHIEKIKKLTGRR